MFLLTASTLAKSVMKYHYASSVLIFMLWIVALLSGSVAVIFVGLLAYLRPQLLIGLLGKPSGATEPKTTHRAISQQFANA